MAATLPTTVTAGGRTCASRARSAMSASVPDTVRWRGRVPRSTTAAGSPASRPWRCSSAASAGKDATPM